MPSKNQFTSDLILALSPRLQVKQKFKQNLRKTVTTPTTTAVLTLPSPLTTTPPSTTGTPSHPHSLPPSQHPPLTSAKQPQDSMEHYHHSKPKSREKKQRTLPAKRTSVDASAPVPKRKKRVRKLSSSNESTASDVPSVASDVALRQGQPFAPSVLPPAQTLVSSIVSPTLAGNKPLPLQENLSPTVKSTAVEHPQPFSPEALGLHPHPSLPDTGVGGGGGAVQDVVMAVTGVGGGGGRKARGSTSSDQSPSGK